MVCILQTISSLDIIHISLFLHRSLNSCDWLIPKSFFFLSVDTVRPLFSGDCWSTGSARWPENPLQSDSRISAYCLTLIQRLFQNDTAFRLINHNTSVITLWSLFIYEQTGHTVKTFIIWVRLQRINCAHLNASHTECGEKLPLYRGGKCHIWHIWVEHISWCRLIRLGEEMRRQICGEFYLKSVCVN